ncbi:hypothetical protein [Pediococcus pentosaceus]|uniref:hypothetical protein n=1 Tax=Pediococcus pentosaceus TaxID=1255 RepID=UPI001362B5EF|nr:hypothetical protein [Pediococcus pentosaceus]QHM64723.1 hypothetical protein C7M48_00428 [Pediococcus pentosaceus]QHM66442.1 hypothetical protein C7M49_00341 [Pediococcus pentosaceus]QHM69405.1 hypothetical protein C7M50_01536 [Pediococcus pentosaceus]
MSEFIIALNEFVKKIGNKQYKTLEKYNTLEQSKKAATEILKKLHDDSSKSYKDFGVFPCYLLDDEPVTNLAIIEVTPALLPDFGDMIFENLDKWSSSECGMYDWPDDWLDGVKDKKVNELNKLVTNFMKTNGYIPNWFNIKNSYLVSLEEI